MLDKDKVSNYMKKAFKTSMSSGDVQRAMIFVDLWQNVLSEDITKVFISDFRNQDMFIQMETLWLFSNKHILEARNFRIEDKFEFEIYYYKNFIMRFQIENRDYDFLTPPTDKSRLNITLDITNIQQRKLLRAAGENCEFLKNVMMEIIKPNLFDPDLPTKTIILNQ